MIITRFARIQLGILLLLSLIAALVLGIGYLRLPALAGIGQYTLHTELPRAGGLYTTAAVTYQGVNVGKVTAVEPTLTGVAVTMRISQEHRIPADATASVHSVSALGEQYVELVSRDPSAGVLNDEQTVPSGGVPSDVGPSLDAVNNVLDAIPSGKIPALLDETSAAVGGLGPNLQRLADSTQSLVSGVRDNIDDVTSILDSAGPLLDSQLASSRTLPQWLADTANLTGQAARSDQAIRGILHRAPPTADQLTAVFGDVGEALPQAVANAEIIFDMLKRYNAHIEQTLVVLPELAAGAQSVLAPDPSHALLDFNFTINQPPPCLTGFIPAPQWRSPADTSTAPIPPNLYCKIPKDTPANVVRGARNYPCVDLPGKRAATPAECRDEAPYVPMGTNPWFGDPEQIVSCPAAAARCDNPPKPGMVIPAPSINNGNNPLPAHALPAPPPPLSDPLTPPGQGTVQCTGQQPAGCTYTPANTAAYRPDVGEVVGPDGTRYTVEDSAGLGADGWQRMLAPASGPAGP